MTQQTATFWGVGPRGRAHDPQIRTRAIFCTVHLTAKFRRPTFNRSAVIMLTKKQTDAAEKIHLAPLCHAGR